MTLTVTDFHRRAAFEAFAWPGWTFERAMAHVMRRALVEARAAAIARREHDRTHAPQTLLERRVSADGARWVTWKRLGPRTVPTFFHDHDDDTTEEHHACRSI